MTPNGVTFLFFSFFKLIPDANQRSYMDDWSPVEIDKQTHPAIGQEMSGMLTQG